MFPMGLVNFYYYHPFFLFCFIHSKFNYEAQIVHYLKVNIPKVGDKILQQGDEITKWVTPAPTINSGQHRYVFFLFKQSEFLQPSKV